MPLSAAARAAGPEWLATCLTGGDDYELLLAVPPGREAALQQAAREAGMPVTRIGGFRAGPPDVMVRGPDGQPMLSPAAAGATSDHRALAGEMNRNVWLLFGCQALMNAVMSGQMVMAALIGHALAVDKALNTLPMAIQMISMMSASIPASIMFARLGRKPGFWLGCSVAARQPDLRVRHLARQFRDLLPGRRSAGLGYGIAQHLRFAAAEVAAPEARPRAISLVMAGGVLAAIIGPEIVKRTNMLLPPLMFLGTYLCLTLLPLIARSCCVRPAAARGRQQRPVPIRTILARPKFLTAVVCSMVGYGTMNLVMASTPLQMMICGFGVNASADVIRAHSIAMFLPGFVTGRLIQRFGAHPIICVGAVLTLFCVAANLAFIRWSAPSWWR